MSAHIVSDEETKVPVSEVNESDTLIVAIHRANQQEVEGILNHVLALVTKETHLILDLSDIPFNGLSHRVKVAIGTLMSTQQPFIVQCSKEIADQIQTSVCGVRCNLIQP